MEVMPVDTLINVQVLQNVSTQAPHSDCQIAQHFWALTKDIGLVKLHNRDMKTLQHSVSCW